MEQESMGKLIKNLRSKKGLTQKQLAELLNITDKAVSKWERDLACPDTAIIPKLAKILDISVEELLEAKATARTDTDEGGLWDAYNEGANREMRHEAEEDKEQYFSELKRTLIISGVSFAIFTTIFANLMGGDAIGVALAAVVGLFYAGAPTGWAITGKAFDNWFASGQLGILMLILRAMLSIVIGIFAFPVKVISFSKKCYLNTTKTGTRRINKQMRRRFFRILGLYFVVLAIVCLLLLIGLAADKNSGNNSESVPPEPVAYSALLERNFNVNELCEKALFRSEELEKADVSSYGFEVTTPSEIKGIYYLNAKDNMNPHYDIGEELYITNAVAVVTDYYVGEHDLHSWNVWLFPNFELDENGGFEYEQNVEHNKSVSAGSIEEIVAWLESEYGEMEITLVPY